MKGIHKAAVFCYGDEENARRACTNEHLATANQGRDSQRVSRLCMGKFLLKIFDGRQIKKEKSENYVNLRKARKHENL